MVVTSYRLGEMPGKFGVVTSYRLGEMSGGFGETGYKQLQTWRNPSEMIYVT